MYKLLKVSALICGILVILISLLPRILSSGKGREYLLSAINQKISGKVSAKKIHIQWFGGVLVEDAVLKDYEGNLIATIKSLSTAQPLWDIARNGWKMHQLRLDDLNATIIQYQSGMTNLQAALDHSLSPNEKLMTLPQTALMLKNVNGFMELYEDNKSALMQFAGKTEQGELQGEFVLHLSTKTAAAFRDVQDLHLSLQVKEFPVGVIDAIISLQKPHLRGVISSLLGKSLNISISKEPRSLEKGLLTLSFTSDNVEVKKAHLLIDDQGIRLQSPVKSNYMLTAKTFSQLYRGNTQLRDTAHFQCTFEEFSYPFSSYEDPSPLHLHTKLAGMSKLQFETVRYGAFSLENTSLDLRGSSLEALQIALAGGITTQEPSLLHAFLGTSTQVHATANLSLTPFCCPQLKNLKAQVDGGLIQFETSGNFQKGEFELSAPATVRYEATPSLIRTLFPTMAGVENIKEKIPLLLTIASQKQFLNFCDFQKIILSGHLSIPSLPFMFGNKAVTLREIMVPWEFDGAEKKAKLSLSGASDFPNKGKKGTFRGRLVVKDWQDNKFFNEASYKAGLDLINFPAEICKMIYPAVAEKVEALMGDVVDASLDLDFRNKQGAIQGTLQGSEGRAALNASYKGGYLRLKEPFIAVVKASPELSSTILHQIAPFLNELTFTSQPLTLRIDPAGFLLPVVNFNLKHITIESCSVNMGKIFFRNGGQLHTLLSLLGGNASKTIPIWVTPLYLAMKEGKIHLKRVDMLLNNLFPIAAWGVVDLVKDKVNMTVGVSGNALATALNIKSISSNYMLQIPFKGSLKNPKLDKRKAAAKISTLIAQDQGTHGMLIGTILDIASGALTETPPPPPTTDPLPWEVL